jgi:hypothetical protein
VSEQNPQQAAARLQAFLQPWHESVADPKAAQEKIMGVLLGYYAQTDYGKEHGASEIKSTEDFRRAFPVVTYEDYKPLIKRVMAGEESLLLSEPPIGWAITRGTTKGESKFIPMTPTDLRMRVSAGRAVMNYVHCSGRFDIIQGVNLNLNFPSVVGKILTGEKEIEYGYSSGIYLKHVSASTPIRSLPTQDEIDALGGGKTFQDWEARFDLAYQKNKEENVTLVGGVAPTAIEFGRFLKRKYGKYPKDLWKVQIMTLGSVAGINTRLKPVLQAMYGPAQIREIYGATEGMFGQQKDDSRAWVPNYDLFFLEVKTGSKIKMLYEMKPGEMGSLIASTPILARYKIGDLIRAFRPPYFRCIGREYWYTPLVYAWGEINSLGFDRL